MSDSILHNINSLEDLRALDLTQLQALAKELRYAVIETVAKTGGHLGGSLGVIELTIALHYVFNTPIDLLVWDIGHQTYPHKILTDRKGLMKTLRQKGGLSGFTKITESVFDTFGAGHSSTAPSAAFGMAIARDITDAKHNVMCVIGDGAMSAGMAYEALNNIGAYNGQMLVVLNDNDMSISPSIGALTNHLKSISSSKLQHKISSILGVQANNMFQCLGFEYVGPIDGHDIKTLISTLEMVKDVPKPLLLHVKTKKGMGFESTELSDESYHSINKFDAKTLKQHSINKVRTYTDVFKECMEDLCKRDERVVCVTAAMLSGSGLKALYEQMQGKVFDVGIAEQHAVTFAAGMALKGVIPFVSMYSTFLQRAYDQVIHDVAVQNIPVRFVIDRAGYVGSDGPTHAGSFDIMYLCNIPNFVVMAPSCEHELAMMMEFAYNHSSSPIAVRFPRGEVARVSGYDAKLAPPIELGRGHILNKGDSGRVAVISFGSRLDVVIAACKKAKTELGVKPMIVDARFAKPLDFETLRLVRDTCDYIITIEEGSSGGFGQSVLSYFADINSLNDLRFKAMHFPDVFIDHATQDEMYQEAGLTVEGILHEIKRMM